MFKLVGFTAGVALYSFVASPALAATMEPLKTACDGSKGCPVSQAERGKANHFPPPSLIPPPPDFRPQPPAPTGVPIKQGG